MSDSCCGPSAASPVAYDYTPCGKVEELAPGLEAYTVAGNKPAALIIVYDIFGYADFPQVKQVADRLSSATGLTVAVPDFFHSKPWSMARFPPKPEDNFMAWITQAGSYDAVKGDLYKAVDALKGRGAARFGVLGCCWGAAIALQAGADAATFSAAGGMHPSLFGKDKEFAEAVNVPVALVSAKGDPLESVQDVVAARPALAAKSVWRRYDDMTHGFCAARGDFKDPLVAQRVGETVQLLAGFLTSTLLE